MPYRWADPVSMFNELRRLQTQFERDVPRPVAGVYPAVNIYDDGECFLIRAEVPGIDKNKLEITTKGNRVSIRGERTAGPSAEQVAYHRRERDMGVFHRIVTLPEHVQPAKTTATYTKGVLEIICPRAESAKAHRVEVA